MFNNKVLLRTSNNFERRSQMSSTIETETEFKSKQLAKSLTETIHNIANEPSMGFYRIEEHVHKSINGLISKTSAQNEMNENMKGMVFDLDYSLDAVSKMANAKTTLDSINNLAADCLFKARELAIKRNLNSQVMASPAIKVKNKTTSSPSPKIDMAPILPAQQIKKESFVTGFLSSMTTTKPFRTSSLSIHENLNKETVKPQRSQTIIFSNMLSSHKTNEITTVVESEKEKSITKSDSNTISTTESEIEVIQEQIEHDSIPVMKETIIESFKTEVDQETVDVNNSESKTSQVYVIPQDINEQELIIETKTHETNKTIIIQQIDSESTKSEIEVIQESNEQQEMNIIINESQSLHIDETSNSEMLINQSINENSEACQN